ncbi:WASH complex subunit 3 isoform X2 [Macrosteles quadrilineatus]|uniref:WASH complex subunit 3 isoform X2 n=1 Tax=Macrosteles quadrilineatus TaxID=74068 RepID=UPI0023E3348A|nr:WASH complex subunit 3 isoform X2 [Macrosteles quadrilineatus]
MTNKLVLDNLSSITSGVDLNKVPPIHQKRLLTFVNHFIITTVSFLNNFAQTCERKLLYTDRKMQKLEAELCILEAKLNSIPGLEEIKMEEKVQVEVPNAGTDVTEKSSDAKIPPAVGSGDNEPGSSQPVESQSAESESATPSAAKDPALARFFKMIQVGVPLPAVKLKMQQEGLDPNLLDS